VGRMAKFSWLKITLLLFFTFLVGARYVFSQSSPTPPNPTDYNVNITGPTITPPDYSKNECPICQPKQFWSDEHGCCQYDFKSSGSGSSLEIVCDQPIIEVCAYKYTCLPTKGCLAGGSKLSKFNPSDLCGKLIYPNERDICLKCMQDNQHVWTALGCIPLSLANIISSYLVKLFVGIGGAGGLLVLIYGSYLILTSEGDTERLKLGRKYIAAAVKGIILIIFGFFIFRVITVGILKIPGFK